MALSPTTTERGGCLPPRKYLADALHDALARLAWAYAREGQGKNLVHFLQAVIITSTDEESLRCILATVNEELGAVEPGERAR